MESAPGRSTGRMGIDRPGALSRVAHWGFARSGMLRPTCPDFDLPSTGRRESSRLDPPRPRRPRGRPRYRRTPPPSPRARRPSRRARHSLPSDRLCPRPARHLEARARRLWRRVLGERRPATHALVGCSGRGGDAIPLGRLESLAPAPGTSPRGEEGAPALLDRPSPRFLRSRCPRLVVLVPPLKRRRCGFRRPWRRRRLRPRSRGRGQCVGSTWSFQSVVALFQP